MSTLVRLAMNADAGAVRDCVISAFEHYIDRIGKPPGPMLLDFESEIREGHTWVAEQEGRIVGALIQYETEHGFYIDTVAASPEMQDMGVGRALLTFAEDEAQRRGFSSIYLCTNSRMTENQVFYPRIGFVEYERKIDSGYDRIYYKKCLSRTYLKFV